MQLISRTRWDAKLARCETALPAGEVRGIAVHYTAAASDQTGDPAERVRAIQRFHQSPAAGGGTGPWCDIAYNFLFSDDGRVFEGRGWGQRSAAQGSNHGNGHYLAVCFLGADKEGRDDVTAAGRRALGQLIAEFERRYGREPEVRPHSAFTPTACPGDELRAFIWNRGWQFEKPDKPKPLRGLPPLPGWWWQWAEWRLGGRMGRRPARAPKVIPPWAWAQLVGLQRFLKRRDLERR